MSTPMQRIRIFDQEPSGALLAWALEGLGKAVRRFGADQVVAVFTTGEFPVGFEEEFCGCFSAEFALADYNYELVGEMAERLFGNPDSQDEEVG